MATTGFCSVCGRTVYVQKDEPPVCPVCLTPVDNLDADDPRADRLGRNEDLARELNEGIKRGISPDLGGEMVVLCECGRKDCSATFPIDHAAYEEVRGHSKRFILVAGHEMGDVERIVSRDNGYLVVEKIGEAGEVAEELDQG